MKIFFLFNHFEIQTEEQLKKLISKFDPVPSIPRNSVILVKRSRDYRQSFVAFIYDRNAKVHFVKHECYVFFNFGNERKFEKDFVSGSEVGAFVSFARREEVYLDLYNRLEGKTWEFLNSIRDYHYLRAYKAELNPFKYIRDDKVLDELRMTKSFRYMEYRGFEEFMFKFMRKRDYRKMSKIEFSMRLKSVSSRVKVDFDFAKKGIIDSRIAAIIGKNGIGKTRCLKEAKNRLVDGEQFRKVISINLYKSLNSPPTPDYVSLNIDPRSPVSFASTISRIVERRRMHDYFDSLEILREVLKKQLNCNDIRVRDFRDNWQSIWDHHPYEPFIYVGEAKFYKENGEEFILSQGQICLLSITVLLLLYVEKNSIVLFDEPESYLHPNYIVNFVSLIERVLERTDSVAIIATHSIFLVREIPKTSVNVLFEDHDGIRLIPPRTETLGASLDRLADEFFFDDDVNKNFEEFVKKTRKKLKGKSSREKLKKLDVLPADLASKVLAND